MEHCSNLTQLNLHSATQIQRLGYNNHLLCTYSENKHTARKMNNKLPLPKKAHATVTMTVRLTSVIRQHISCANEVKRLLERNGQDGMESSASTSVLLRS